LTRYVSPTQLESETFLFSIYRKAPQELKEFKSFPSWLGAFVANSGFSSVSLGSCPARLPDPIELEDSDPISDSNIQ
ncbi:MAG: hypothetical protein HW389_1712, partial [Bacteroidetes bacterium]|nr:hypothetical protein [Bacteroidota bacterium]